MTEKQKLPPLVEEYISEQKKLIPSLEILVKEESPLMQSIAKVFAFTKISPKFLTQYFTTIGTKIYVPKDMFGGETIKEIQLLEVMMHEMRHVKDFKKFPILFVLGYLSPQVFALLAFLSFLAVFGNLYFLFFLFCLFFIAPIPSPIRFWLELRAYRISLIFFRKVYGYTDLEMEQFAYPWIIKQLATKFYYFTWPFKSHTVKLLKNEAALESKIYEEVNQFIEDKVLVKLSST